MIDHVGFAVGDAERSRLFYQAALAPIGITLLRTVTPEQTEASGTVHGFGRDRKAFFWVGDNEAVGEGTHIAFAVQSRSEVDAFHAASIQAGGRDNGAPGLRPHYGPDYYAAFVFDPDGNNIEAVCREPA